MNNEPTDAEYRASLERAMCIHRWKIASPNGETCPAVCKSCGAERVFGSAAPLLTPAEWMRVHPKARGLPKKGGSPPEAVTLGTPPIAWRPTGVSVGGSRWQR